MFTRRPAAKIIAREQNGRRAITRLIEHETGIFPAVGADAPCLEGVIAQARLVAGRHMLDPHDHVGVDVRLEQGGGDAGQEVAGRHRSAERRVGREIVRTWRARRSTDHRKKKKNHNKSNRIILYREDTITRHLTTTEKTS